MPMIAIVNLILFVALLVLLYQFAKHEAFSLSRRVFLGLIGGSVFGLYLQAVFGGSPVVMDATLEWISVIADSFIALLRMMIVPLVLITMIAAVLKVEKIKSLGKIGGTVVGTLIATTVIAALIGIMIATVFQLNASDLSGGASEMAELEVLEEKQASVVELSIAELLVSFVPRNIFSDLAEQRSMSIIAVVIFGLLFGIAALLVAEESPEHGSRIRKAIDTLQAIIMRLVKLVIAMTPYAVLALMTIVIATSDGHAIMNLINFVVASYVAVALMFVVHAAIVIGLGTNIKTYFKKVWPVLTFAFVTRSSVASIPLMVRVQLEEFKVPAPIASISASFGSTIGQNGCAGIYPAMLAVMVAPTVGVDVDLNFIMSLLVIIAIGSFGIAGVGGGATNAALLVLPAMGFPVTVVALLISIEPLIDMARTALNVNGAITTGMLTTRLFGDKAVAGEATLETLQKL